MKASPTGMPSDVALAWLLHNPVVTAAIRGPRTAEQLRQNLKALSLRLSSKALTRLDEIWPGAGGEAPQACAWKLKAPAGGTDREPTPIVADVDAPDVAAPDVGAAAPRPPDVASVPHRPARRREPRVVAPVAPSSTMPLGSRPSPTVTPRSTGGGFGL